MIIRRIYWRFAVICRSLKLPDILINGINQTDQRVPNQRFALLIESETILAKFAPRLFDFGLYRRQNVGFAKLHRV